MEFFSRNIQPRDEALLETLGALGSQVGQYVVRKQAEHESRRAQEQLQAILDNSTAVVYVKDVRTSFRYLLVNRKFEALFGKSRMHLKGKDDYDLFPRELAEVLRANDQKVFDQGTPLEFEEKILQDDGEHTYISLKFLLRDAAGDPYAVCGISTDITDRKLLEDTKKFALHDKAHLMDRAEFWLGRIATLGQEVPGLSERLPEMVRKVRTVIRWARAEARATLSFLDPPRGEPTWSELGDCNGLLGDWFAEMRWLTTNTVIDMLAVSQLDGVPFLAKQDEVLVALHNLQSNAEKAITLKTDTVGSPRLILFSVGVEKLEYSDRKIRHAEYIVLRSADNGVGISASKRDGLFEIRTVPAAGGHGLGSRIIRRIMDDHQGLIRLATRENVGTLIELWFPCFVKGDLAPTARSMEDVRDDPRGRRSGPFHWRGCPARHTD